MKNKILFLSLFVVLVLVLSGCTSNSQLKDEEIQIKKIEEQEVVLDDSEKRVVGENFNREKITGEISKVVGNMITIELYEVPEKLGDGIGSAEKLKEVKPTNPLTGTTTTKIIGKGGMKSGMGSKVMTFEKTGESKVVTIPVGTEIKVVNDPDLNYEIENLSRGMSIIVIVDSELTEKEKESNSDSNIIYADSVNIILN